MYLPLDGAGHILPSSQIKRRTRRYMALKLYPTGTKVSKTFLMDGKEVRMKGEVFNYYAPFWHVRWENSDWNECDGTEVEKDSKFIERVR